MTEAYRRQTDGDRGPELTDAGVESGAHVTQEEVFRVFSANTERLREVLFDVIGRLPLERSCPCPSALDGIDHDLVLP